MNRVFFVCGFLKFADTPKAESTSRVTMVPKVTRKRRAITATRATKRDTEVIITGINIKAIMDPVVAPQRVARWAFKKSF